MFSNNNDCTGGQLMSWVNIEVYRYIVYTYSLIHILTYLLYIVFRLSEGGETGN